MAAMQLQASRRVCICFNTFQFFYQCLLDILDIVWIVWYGFWMFLNCAEPHRAFNFYATVDTIPSRGWHLGGWQQFHGLCSCSPLRCIQIPSSPRWRAKPSSGRLSFAVRSLRSFDPTESQCQATGWLEMLELINIQEYVGWILVIICRKKTWKSTIMFRVMFAVAGELQTIQHQVTRRGLLYNTSSTVAGNHDLILGRWFEHFSLLYNAVGCPDARFTCNHFRWNPWRLSARRRLHDS